eukprot:COSAG01_NODE_12973_length_1655_cov_1.755784_2_plen_225_part_01
MLSVRSGTKSSWSVCASWRTGSAQPGTSSKKRQTCTDQQHTLLPGTQMNSWSPSMRSSVRSGTKCSWSTCVGSRTGSAQPGTRCRNYQTCRRRCGIVSVGRKWSLSMWSSVRSDTHCSWSTCVGLRTGSAQPGTRRRNYQTCKCLCSMVSRDRKWSLSIRSSVHSGTKCSLCTCARSRTGSAQPGTKCRNYQTCRCLCSMVSRDRKWSLSTWSSVRLGTHCSWST